MEQLWITIAEKSIVGAGFLMLLYYLINKNNATLMDICDSLTQLGEYMQKMSENLLKLDMRMGMLEQRIMDLEKK